MSDSDIPANPNLPDDTVKIQKNSSRKNLIPKDQEVLPDQTDKEDEFVNDITLKGDKTHEVKTYGKIAKFPKNIKASKAYNFLENVKISKKSIWYIMVENDNELQMVKYNNKAGVDLNKFVNELKNYYLSNSESNENIHEAISKIFVDGNDKYSMIRNIPLIEVNGKKMITKITEDLIKLLSK
jgi:Fe-S-cluster formation regulator IscX/YfhJ